MEAALGLLKDAVRPLIVDVGTGSGCIALSLAAARPDAEVHAVDVSRAALDVARGNATRLRLAGRVAFHEGDLLSPIGSRAGRVDLVVSNPPYVSAEEWRGLEPEVRDHEPRLALVPAEGAPALYRRLLAAAGRVLRPGGSIAVEVGQGTKWRAWRARPAWRWAPSSPTSRAFHAWSSRGGRPCDRGHYRRTGLPLSVSAHTAPRASGTTL